MALTDAADPLSEPRNSLRSTILALMGMTRTTQTALAEVAGMEQPSLSKRLKLGGPPFTEDHLARIADFFGLDSPADLYRTSEAVTRFRSRCFSLLPAVTGQGVLFEDVVVPAPVSLSVAV